MKDKLQYLVNNTLIFAISSFGTKFLSFLLVPLYTSILSTADYGTIDIATTTAIILIYVFTLSIQNSVLRFAMDRAGDRAAQRGILHFGFRIIFTGSAVLAVLLAVTCATGIVGWSWEYYLFIFAYFFFTAIYETLMNYLRAIDQTKDVAAAGILSTLAIILGNIVLLLVVRAGVVGYAISLVLGPLVGTLYGVWRAGLLSRAETEACPSPLKKEMLAYCSPLILNNLALWINGFLSRYFVMALCGAAVNGLYAVSNKIPTILSTCYGVFSQAWTLSAIKDFDRDDDDAFFSSTYGVYQALIVLVCSGLILLNIPIARLLFAKDFFDAWQYSSVLLISVMFNALTSFQGSIFAAVKDTKTTAKTTMISAAVNVVLCILLIPPLGALGAAIATAAAYIVMWAIRLAALKKYITMRIRFARDLAVYALLVVQVLFERLGTYGYIGQVLAVLAIVLLNKEYMGMVVAKLRSVIGGKLRRD